MSAESDLLSWGDEHSAADPALLVLLRGVEDLLTAVRRNFPEIPETVTIIVPRGRRRMLAYFSPGCWRVHGGEVDEIGISAEHLGDGIESVATSVLHEAAHARARALGIRDASRGGRWHNRRFAELAFDMGLKVVNDGRVGCTTPGLRDQTLIQYADELRALERALVLVRQSRQRRAEPVPGSGVDDPEGGGAVASGKYVSAVCHCVTESNLPRRIRIAARSWEEHSIWCRLCRSFFRVAEREAS